MFGLERHGCPPKSQFGRFGHSPAHFRLAGLTRYDTLVLGRGKAVKRRKFITLVGGAAAWPFAARGQRAERTRRVGALLPATADDAVFQARIGAFLQELERIPII
jgi:hypothetical protein